MGELHQSSMLPEVWAVQKIQLEDLSEDLLVGESEDQSEDQKTDWAQIYSVALPPWAQMAALQHPLEHLASVAERSMASPSLTLAAAVEKAFLAAVAAAVA